MLFVWDELAVNGLRTWICGRYDSSRRLFRAKERGRFFACPADTGRTIFAVITPTLILLHIHTVEFEAGLIKGHTVLINH